MSERLVRRNFFKTLLSGAGALFVGMNARLAGAVSGQEGEPAEKLEPANATIKTIQTLRTIHGNFTDKEIPEAELQMILQSSLRAANASNMQSYSIIVVKDREKMQQLCGYRGSCLLVFCVDHNRLKISSKAAGYEFNPADIVSFVTASVDTGLVVQTAAIAARSLGIDYLITNGIHRGDMERLWKILELPKTHCFPFIAMVLGYPTEEPAYYKGRLNGAGVIHYDKYHKLTDEEVKEIAAQYEDKSTHIALTETWDKDGYKRYADWYFGYWLKDDPEAARKETQMFKLLKKSGYIDLQKS